jgi:hypothetical protein
VYSALNGFALNQSALNADGGASDRLAATEANDVFSGVAVALVQCYLAATEPGDVFSASARAVAHCALAAVEASDVFAAIAHAKDCRNPKVENLMVLASRRYVVIIPDLRS